MTHYVGGILEKVAGAGVTKWRQYIPTPSGHMVLISRDPNATGAILYVVSDHLGSSDTLLDQTGAIKPKLSFDVFVARRGGDWITTTAPDCTNVASTTRAASQLALGRSFWAWSSKALRREQETVLALHESSVETHDRGRLEHDG